MKGGQRICEHIALRGKKKKKQKQKNTLQQISILTAGLLKSWEIFKTDSKIVILYDLNVYFTNTQKTKFLLTQIVYENKIGKALKLYCPSLYKKEHNVATKICHQPC